MNEPHDIEGIQRYSVTHTGEGRSLDLVPAKNEEVSPLPDGNCLAELGNYCPQALQEELQRSTFSDICALEKDTRISLSLFLSLSSPSCPAPGWQ
jgi:hypothetical protein